MSPVIEVPWGSALLTVELPDRWRLLGTLEPERVVALTDPESVLRSELANPIDTVPLRDRPLAGQRIVIVVEDVSRPVPVHTFFRALLQELIAGGATLDGITLLTALGVHRPMTREEVEAKVGRENLAGIAWHNHDARDPRELVFVGTTSRGTPVQFNRRLTEADLIVCVGGIEPHVLLGFSGGAKMLLPGCAAAETVARNHLQGVSPERFNLVGVPADQSPMRLDLEDAAHLLQKDIFIVNAILNRQHSVCRFFCGHHVEAQRRGAEFSRRVHGVPLSGPADVALVGSDPMSFDLRQSMKCVGNNMFCVKPGGVIAGFVRCEQGVGDVDIPPRSLPPQVLRTLLRVLGPSRIMGFVDRVKKGAGVEEKFLAHFALQVCRRNALHLFSDNLPPWVGRKTGLFRQYSDVQAMVSAAARQAPRNATVWFVPHGGFTYPVVPNPQGIHFEN